MTVTSTGAPLTVLTEDEALFRDGVSEFAQAEIAPRARAMDAAGRYDEDLLPKLFEMGLMGIDIPASLGGAGGTFFQSCLAVEQISRADAAVGVLVDVQNTLVNNAIAKYGTSEQKSRYLARTAADTVASYCLSEAGSGSDAFALQCRAVPKGDRFVLDGHKMWITNAAEAGLFLVFATVDPSAGYKGITAFLVLKSDAGFSLGKREDKLGIRASSTCELLFEGCAIPSDRVVGQIGRGYKIAIETLNEGRIGIGAQMLGVAQAALDAAVRYASSRRCASSSRTPRRGSRRRACWSTTRRACGTRGSPSPRRPRWRSCTPRRRPSGSRRRRSRCSAGTATRRSTRWRSSTAT